MERKDKKNLETTYETLIEIAENNRNTEELDLHGMDVHDAEHAVDHFLDKEFLAGTSVVKITYGIGTGRLAEEIPEFLKKHPHVLMVKSGKSKGVAAYAVLNV